MADKKRTEKKKIIPPVEINPQFPASDPTKVKVIKVEPKQEKPKKPKKKKDKSNKQDQDDKEDENEDEIE